MNIAENRALLVTAVIIAMGLAMVATHKLAGTGYSTTAAIYVPLAAVVIGLVLMLSRRRSVLR